MQQSEELRTSGAFESMQMLNFSRAYPDQDIPPGAFYRGYEQHEKMKERSLRNGPDSWEAKGPWNTAGRCLSISVNPQDPNTIYAGTASGGLWRSRDLGLSVSWERINTGFPVLGVSDIEFARGDSSVMFIGTGEVYNSVTTGTDGAYRPTRGSYGIGILKSTDGGQSWEKSLDWTYQNQRGVWMIKIDPNDDQVVYAGTTQGVFKSIDQGDNWDLVLDVPMCTDVEINPENTDQIVASCGNLYSPGKGIYKSIDGGSNWNRSNGIDDIDFGGKIQITFAPSQPNIMYASIGNGLTSETGATWLCESNDFGANWQVRNTTDVSRWQGWFSHDLAVDPEDPFAVISVGIDTWFWDTQFNTINQISNGGVTLGTPTIGEPDGGPNYSHSDHHFVMYHPSIPNLVLLGNDGGIFHLDQTNMNFRSATGGMQTTQFYNGFSVSNEAPIFAMGGLQDNSTVIYRGNQAWTRVVGGDGSWTGINSIDNDILYASFQNLNVLRSTNAGGFFRRVNLDKPDDDIPIFIAPYALAPSDPNVIYGGSNYLYRAINGDDFEIRNAGNRVSENPISSMDISSQDSDVLYFGTAPFPDGDSTQEPQIFISTDGGETVLESAFDFPNRLVNDIHVDPTDHSIAYAAFSGFGTSHLFKTTDFGETWFSIDNGLPDVPGNAIVVDPSNNQLLYYGNDIGVYFSEDGGNNWQTWEEGLPNACIIMDLKINEVDRTLWLASHGCGAYERPLEEMFVSTDQALLFKSLDLFPNPAKEILNLKTAFNSNQIEFRIYNALGQLKMDGEPSGREIQIGSLEAGLHFIEVDAGEERYRSSFVKAN